MGIETFPAIENFQKLPHQVIVKGGAPQFDARDGAQLAGIVINNIGHTIRDLKINLVVFDEKKIPEFNTSTVPTPALLPQGTIATFVFQLKAYPREISDYHMYVNWRFDDRE